MIRVAKQKFKDTEITFIAGDASIIRLKQRVSIL
jgi:ubiquinone/menaquinone biosynthesis C-methylase UbiE